MHFRVLSRMASLLGPPLSTFSRSMRAGTGQTQTRHLFFVLRLRYKFLCTVRRVELGPWIGRATGAIDAVSRTESHGPVALFPPSRRRPLEVADLFRQRPPPMFLSACFAKKQN